MKINLTRVLLIIAVAVAMFTAVQAVTVLTHTPVAHAGCGDC
jgi:hypothetical protein